MLRHRSSLERHFTPKASALCFPSVKGRFCSPSVLIYREVRVRTRGTATKKRPASASRFSILWWAVRGSACSAGGRCGASRLARCAGKRSRVSSAPRPDGFEPMHRQQKSGRHPPVAFLFYGGPSGVQPAPQAAAAALRALRAALANAHAFPQLRAPTGSNPCTGNKKATNRSRSLSFLWWAVRGSNPGPWD